MTAHNVERVNTGHTRVVISAISPGKEDTHNYQYEVLKMSLDRTVDTHGAYELKRSKTNLKNLRALNELKKPDGVINVHITTTSLEREKSAIPIRIPIRMGVLNYRLLMVNKSNMSVFDSVRTADDLRKLRAGVVFGWVTKEILEAENFRLVESLSSQGIFKMLDNDRFDYLPRGVHQVYSELENITADLNNVVIEPNLAIYLPAPFYVFVSLSEPALAARLELGLEEMVADGSLREIFSEYYSDAIAKAQLDRRRVIYIENPFLSESTPMHRPELWFFHSDDFSASVNLAKLN